MFGRLLLGLTITVVRGFLEPSERSNMKLIWKYSLGLKVVIYFHKKIPSEERFWEENSAEVCFISKQTLR